LQKHGATFFEVAASFGVRPYLGDGAIFATKAFDFQQKSTHRPRMVSLKTSYVQNGDVEPSTIYCNPSPPAAELPLHKGAFKSALLSLPCAREGGIRKADGRVVIINTI